VAASRSLSRILGLRVALGAALLASACQHDSNAVFDDSDPKPSDQGGSSTGAQPTAGSDALGAAGGADGGTNASGGTSSDAGKPAAGATTGGKPSGGGGKGGTNAGGNAGQPATAGKSGMGGTTTGMGGGGTAGMGGNTNPDPEPVTVEETDIADTQVSSCAPNANYGEAVSMNVDGDDFCTLYMLVNPSLLKIPDGAIVSDATLTLNCTNVGGAVTVSYVNESWGEDQVRWNNRPEVGSSLGTFTCENVGPVTIDLKAAVKAWLGGDHKPYGIYFRTESADGSDYDTSEAIKEGTPPVLSVTYTLPAK
jgi:hypothetical protein